MNQILLINIHQLINVRRTPVLLRGKDLAELPIINNAWLLINDGRIADFGSMDACPNIADIMDLNGKSVLPCWCDSHTHLVFAASREEEFVDKIKGMSYAEIAAKGGGILNSARRVALTTADELYQSAKERLIELIRLGTGAIEIKSGYGLSTDAEIKMLRVIKRLKESSPIPIKATFLGAHTYPQLFKEDHEAYIDQIINDMLPAIDHEQLADFIDVFCEEGFFSAAETIRICEAGKKIGLRPKIHANQLSLSGGVQAGLQTGAISVDHLETIDDETIQLLAASDTIGTVLPTAVFFLRMPFQPARKLIDAGAAIALASDYNPGSSPSGNMNMVVSMGSIQLRMLPEEAINAATLNGAYAMGLQKEVGSITVGKRANLIITKPIPSVAYIPYAFGSNLIDKVLIEGKAFD